MDDVLKRLGAVESTIADLRSQVSGLATQVTGLAMQMGGFAAQLTGLTAQVTELTADVSGLKALSPHLATKADIIHIENSILRWLIATVIAGMGLVFVIAKYTS